MTESETAAGESPPAAALGSRPTFVGRQHERAVLRSALDAALGGRGRLVVLAGEPGVGKTRLADELAAEASVRGAVVAWGHCWEGGGAPAYWPWIQILRRCLGEATPLPSAEIPESSPLLPLLRREGVAGPAGDETDVRAVDPPDERFRVFDATTSLLATLSRARPLVLIVDDAHAADAASLDLLRFLARDLRGMAVLVIATLRDLEVRSQPALSAAVADLGREGGTLTLGGLSDEDVGRLVEASLGEAPEHATVEMLHQATEGNPFFLTEILRLRAAGGDAVDGRPGRLGALAIPDSVRAAIRQRLASLSGATREILAVAAVLGREFDLRVLAAAAGRGLEAVVLAVDEAEANGAVARAANAGSLCRFTHALIRETLYHDIAQAERRHLHRAAAVALEETHVAQAGDHLAEIAHHYRRALPVVSPRTAAVAAHRAAAHAHAVLAYQDAARVYEIAVEALEMEQPPDAEEICSMMLRLGESLYGAGLFERARDSFARAAEIARGLGSADRLARAALGFGLPPVTPYVVDEPVVALLEEALAALPRGDSTLRAMLFGRLAAELYWSAERGRGAALSLQALEMARRLGDSRTLIYVLHTRHVAAWHVDNLEERLAIAAEIVDLAARPENRVWAIRVWGLRARYIRFTDLLERGEMSAFDVELERYARLAAELRQSLGYEQLARATRALMAARFEEAERMGDEALAVAQRLERRTRAFRQAVNSHRLILRREQQRLEEMEPIFARARRPSGTSLARASLAHCLAELGRSEEAAREFEQIAGMGFESLPRDPGWIATMVLLAEVCVSLHDAERAARLHHLLVPYAERNATLDIHVCYGPVAHYLGMLSTTAGEFDSAEGHFEAAQRLEETMGAPLWAAHTRYQRARMLLARDRGGDRAAAASLAESTLATAESLGLTSLAAKLRSLLAAATTDGGNVTILFTDIEDSTGLTERLGDARAQELIQLHNALVREQVGRYQGVEVKSLGDGFMLAFAEPGAALHCAVAIQRALAAHRQRHPETGVAVAMGLHCGEAIRDRGDFYGRTVILAARIRSHARGGQILASAAVRDAAGGAAFDRGRDVELKGFTAPHRLYRVDWEG